jgi:hypothetical protein
MKKFYMILAVLMLSLGTVKGQQPFYSCTVNFEDDPCWEGAYWNITMPGSNNIWQVCVPHKTVFDSAYSSPHAILTDSTGTYPVNDTSSFIINALRQPGCECAFLIGGWYKFDSDTLKDFGKIEISIDHGTTWLNILDTVNPSVYWTTPKPVLTGRIHQWREFNAFLNNGFWNDTLYYRFTFISDNIQTNQEGWMLDNIQLIAHMEGIPDIASGNEINIYPNPATNIITVSATTFTGEMDVSVYDILGQLHLKKILNDNKGDIDISGLNRGIYMVRVTVRNNYWARKIVKE